MAELTELDPEQVAFARSVDEAYLACRVVRHSWELPLDLFRVPGSYGWFPGTLLRVLECTRCGTQKLQFLTERHDVFYQRYLYPDGYLFRSEAGRVKLEREVLLAEALRRAKVVAKLPAQLRERVESIEGREPE